jgi:hypothetical protein
MRELRVELTPHPTTSPNIKDPASLSLRRGVEDSANRKTIDGLRS